MEMKEDFEKRLIEEENADWTKANALIEIAWNLRCLVEQGKK